MHILYDAFDAPMDLLREQTNKYCTATNSAVTGKIRRVIYSTCDYVHYIPTYITFLYYILPFYYILS